MASDESKPMRLNMRVVITILGVVFLAMGATKLLGLSFQNEFFAQLRLPRWLVPAVGGVEFIVGLLTLNRSTHSYGAVGVVLVMVGAALTHVMTGVMLQLVFVNALLLVAAIWVVIKDRPFFLRVV